MSKVLTRKRTFTKNEFVAPLKRTPLENLTVTAAIFFALQKCKGNNSECEFKWLRLHDALSTKTDKEGDHWMYSALDLYVNDRDRSEVILSRMSER